MNVSSANKSTFSNATSELFALVNGSVRESSAYFFHGDGECPKWIIYGFLVVFFLGSCVNLFETFVLIRSKKTGILSIVLEITLADTIVFFVAILELFTSYHQTWKFTNQTCMLYSGTEILANTLVAYLLICLNFHVITFWNLHNVETLKNKNPLTSYNESSSSECLVTRSENRMVTIDYRKRKNDVPVMFPILFVWILCLSVSMPKYALTSTVEIQGRIFCVIIHNFYGKILHSLLLIFSVIVPCFLLFISLLILLYKLSKTSRKNIDNALSKQFEEIRQLLFCSIILTTFYMLTSYQKHIFSTTVTIKELFISENYYYNNFSNVYQIMLHYSGSSFRGTLFYAVLPSVKRAIRDKLLFCYNKET